MAGLSDTKHLFVIGKESFQAAFLNQDCGIPEKILYRLFGFLTSLAFHLFCTIKRLSDDGYAGMTKKKLG